MAIYRIYRIRETAHQHFRWAAHTAGATQVKQKDYEPDGEIEAESPYAAWTLLREAGTPLRVGDLLEIEPGTLRICKYVGFEEASWFVPAAPAPPAGEAGQETPSQSEVKQN